MHKPNIKDSNTKRRGQKGNSPKSISTSILFTLNFLTFDPHEFSPAYKHWGGRYTTPTPLPLVWGKDPLTSKWTGPHPLLTQRRGHACVFFRIRAKPIVDSSKKMSNQPSWPPRQQMKGPTIVDCPEGGGPTRRCQPRGQRRHNITWGGDIKGLIQQAQQMAPDGSDAGPGTLFLLMCAIITAHSQMPYCFIVSNDVLIDLVCSPIVGIVPIKMLF